MTSGWLADGETTWEPSPWNRWVQAGEQPAAVARPEAYAGGDTLTLCSAPAGATPREQRALLQAWCEALPTLGGVRRLWLGARVPQALFDAACRLPGLQGLWMKSNQLRTLDAAAGHATLALLHLGPSPALESLDLLPRLPALRWFQVDGARKPGSLEPLRGLVALEGLGFTGGDGKGLEVPSFEPLAGLAGLRWLHLGSVVPADGSLRPLGGLTGLRWLGLPNRLGMAEFAWLSRRLACTKGDWLAPYARFHRSVFPCPKCKANGRVMTTGRGSRLLCPDCDAAALARHVAAWDAAVASG